MPGPGSRWFVTGTDTEIGKSVVTACLAQAARRWGSVVAAKPVASGVEPGTAGEDAELLGAAAGHPPLVLRTWRAPLSPHRAALAEGRPVDPEALDGFCRGLAADTVLVEGVGGWRVPLRADHVRYEVRDLARATGGRVVVVAADRLGVINHTRLTVEAVRADGLNLAGVVLNRGVGDASEARSSNLDDLRLLIDVPVAVLEALDVGDPAAREAAGAGLWADLT